MQNTLLNHMMKGILALALVCFSVPVTFAQSWTIHVEEDLFSDTGKSARLHSGERTGALLFECDANGLRLAYLLNEPLRRDEASGRSFPAGLVVKVDDHEAIRFSTALSRRNEHYMHAQIWAKDHPKEIPELLEQIREAKSKVIVGLMVGEHRQSNTVSVTGSTKATTTFLEVCGVKSEAQ